MKYKVECRENEDSLPYLMELTFAISPYSAKMSYDKHRKKLEASGTPTPFRFITLYEDDRRIASRDFQTQAKWTNYP